MTPAKHKTHPYVAPPANEKQKWCAICGVAKLLHLKVSKLALVKRGSKEGKHGA